MNFQNFSLVLFICIRIFVFAFFFFFFALEPLFFCPVALHFYLFIFLFDVKILCESFVLNSQTSSSLFSWVALKLRSYWSYNSCVEWSIFILNGLYLYNTFTLARKIYIFKKIFLFLTSLFIYLFIILFISLFHNQVYIFNFFLKFPPDSSLCFVPFFFFWFYFFCNI